MHSKTVKAVAQYLLGPKALDLFLALDSNKTKLDGGLSNLS